MAAITRSQFRTAVVALLEAQRTATPTLLRKVAAHRPGGMANEKPVSWIGEITSELTYDAGTRTHVMTTEAVIATTFPADNPADDFDDLMDALIDRFTATPQAIANTILELTGIEPSPVAIDRADGGSDVYRGAVLSIRLRIWEGRT